MRHVSRSIVPIQAVVEQVGSALGSPVVDPLPIFDARGGEVEFLAPGVVGIEVESGRKGVAQTGLEGVIAGEAGCPIQAATIEKRIRKLGNELLNRPACQASLKWQKGACCGLVRVGNQDIGRIGRAIAGDVLRSPRAEGGCGYVLKILKGKVSGGQVVGIGPAPSQNDQPLSLGAK